MPQRQLLVGPSFTDLRSEAFERADRLADDGIGRIAFVEWTSYRHDEIADAWACDHNPLRLLVSDLDGLAERIDHRVHGPSPGIDAEIRRRILECALEVAGDRIGFEDARRYTDLFSKVFRSLEREGCFSGADLEIRVGDRVTPDRFDLLVDAFDRCPTLRESLVHPEARPKYATLDALAETSAPLSEATEHLDVVVLSGMADLGAVEWKLIDRLAESLHVIALLPQTRPGASCPGVNRAVRPLHEGFLARGFDVHQVTTAGSHEPLRVADALYTGERVPLESEAITWHESPTPDRTVRHVARRIRFSLAAGAVDHDDILVVVPGLLTYRDFIADAFETYEIDHAVHLSVFLEHTYVGRAVKDAVALCERPSADRVVDLVANPMVDVADVDSAAVADVQRRLYTDDIWQLRRHLDPDDAEGITALLDAARAVRSADADTFGERLRQLFEVIGITLEDGIDTEAYEPTLRYEHGAVRKLQEVLASVESVLAEVGADDPLRAFGEALDVRVSTPPSETVGRVAVVGMEDTPMMTASHVYVLAPTAEVLPSLEHQPRFVRQLADALDVLPPERERELARYRFGLLVANADRVHIATPQRTTDDERILVSPLIDELSRVASLEPTTGVEGEPIAAAEDLQRTMGHSMASTTERRRAVEASQSFKPAQRRRTLRGIDCASARAENTLTEYDAQLDPDVLPHLERPLIGRPFSPNRLTAYSTCGFKYLVERGLGMDEPERIAPGMDTRESGRLVHRLLQRFVERLQETPGEPVILTAYDREDLETVLLEVSLETIDDMGFEVTSIFDERLLAILFEGLGDSDVNPYYDRFGTDHDIDDGLLVRFLDEELADTSDRHPALVEFGFDDLVVEPPEWVALIELRGKVDRVDLDPSRTSAAIYDYKTSSRGRLRETEKRAIGGLDFQLPIYALVGLGMDGVEEVESAYYQVRPTPSVERFSALGGRLEKTGVDETTFLDAVTPRRIGAVVEAIEAGAFHPTLVGADHAGCTYCGFRDSCDVRHHRRHEIRDEVATADRPLYVPDLAVGDRWDVLEEALDDWVGGEPDE